MKQLEESKLEVLGRTQDFLESYDDVVFVGVKQSNGEDDLVVQEVIDYTRIEDGILRTKILDLFTYEDTKEDVVEDILTGYEDLNDKEKMVF